MTINVGTYVEKYSWALNVLLLIVLAMLSAATANNCVRSGYAFPLQESNWQPPATEASPSAAGDSYKVDIQEIENRNLFNSEIREEVVAAQPEEVIQTNVNLCIQGIVYGPQWRFATIMDTDKREIMVLGEGEEVAPGLILYAIEPDRIVVVHKNGQKEETYIDFSSSCGSGTGRPRTAGNPALPMRPGAGNPPTISGPATPTGGVQALSETEYVIDRAMFEAALADINKLVTEARMVPNFTPDRQVDGFRIFQIRPGSIYQQLGLRNGDVIEMVNGIKLDDPTKGLELFQALKSQSHFTINLKRYNNKMTFNYDVR